METTTIQRLHERMYQARENLEMNPQKTSIVLHFDNYGLSLLLELSEKYGSRIGIDDKGAPQLCFKHFVNDTQFILVSCAGNTGYNVTNIIN